MFESFSGIAVTFAELRYELHGLTADGERIAAEVLGVGRLKDGRPWANTYHFLFIVRDEQIVAVKEYMDTGYVASMFVEP